MYAHIKAAVAGTGFIGPVHVEALRRLGVTVKGVMGSSAQKSKAACERLGLEKVYSTFDDMLNDDELDSVHLAVPNIWHFDMARRALEAGKHVMCEKPLAMNSHETSLLKDLADGSGLVAAVTYNIRFYPMNLEARDRVSKGQLGDIFSIVGKYVQDWLLYDTDYNWRVTAEKGGKLRAVADIGTHWMDLITSITGLEVSEVFADLRTVHPVRMKPTGDVQTFSGKQPGAMDREQVAVDTEDCGSILFRFKQGGQGVLWVSQVTAGRKNQVYYEIAGSRQSLAWDSQRPNELWLGHRDKPNEILTKDPSLCGDLARSFFDYPGGHHEGFPDSFKQCFRAYYQAIDKGHMAEDYIYPTFADGHREVMICEAILSSSQTGKWVSV